MLLRETHASANVATTGQQTKPSEPTVRKSVRQCRKRVQRQQQQDSEPVPRRIWQKKASERPTYSTVPRQTITIKNKIKTRQDDTAAQPTRSKATYTK